jgi:hypothetical protein
MLSDDAESTEFGLDEWSRDDLQTLSESLVEAEIPHRWEGRTLLVARDAEHVVDDLLDAIEAGEVASLDEDAEAPDGALHDLYMAADRLARDAAASAARATVLELTPQLSPAAPPFGIAVRAWAAIVDHANAVVAVFDDGADPERVRDTATELRAVCRPYV